MDDRSTDETQTPADLVPGYLMPGYGASTYGDRFADVYDTWYHDVSNVEAQSLRSAV